MNFVATLNFDMYVIIDIFIVCILILMYHFSRAHSTDGPEAPRLTRGEVGESGVTPDPVGVNPDIYVP